jgi:hypothetical protein
LACALEGEADYIVSGDRHLLDVGLYQEIKIIKAKVFGASGKKSASPGWAFNIATTGVALKLHPHCDGHGLFYSKDKNIGFNDLVDDTIGFDNFLPVLVTVSSGKLRWDMAALRHLGKALACLANKPDQILSCARIAGSEYIAKDSLKVMLGLLQHENLIRHQS